MKNQTRWLWYPGDFEIHQGMVQNLQREERGMAWPAYWNISDCNHNVRFTRTYQLTRQTTFTVYAKGVGNVAVDELRHPLGQPIIVEMGTHQIDISVGNLTGLPSIYIEGDLVCSDDGWIASDFIRPLPAASDPLFINRYQDPNQLTYDTTEIRPVSVIEKGHGVLFDFGRELNGTVSVKTSRPIKLCYGESAAEAVDVDRCYYQQDHVTNQSEVRRRAFRFIFVPDMSQEEVYLTAKHQFIDKPLKASFSSDCSKLNQIWHVSQETLRLCSDVFFIDGIKRDRWIWAGDAYQELLSNQYSFFDENVNKRTLLALRGQDEIKQQINTILDYSMLWVISILNHYQMTGDKTFLTQVYPRMKSMVTYLEAQTNELGFIYSRPGDWVFIDWANIDKTGTVAAEQMLLLEVYKTASICDDLLGVTENNYNVKYRKLHDQMMKYFWDEQLGAFIDSYESGKRHVTRHANILAIVFGLVDKTTKEKILHHVLLNSNIERITTPYFQFFEQDALCKAGQYDAVYHNMLGYWGGMLDHDAVTFWEEFDPDQKDASQYAMYGDPYAKSLCHGWGASPLYLIGRHFIGLQPTDAGYQHFEVKPQLSFFHQLNVTLPIKDGYLTIKKEETLLSVLTNRSGGTVIVSGRSYSLNQNQTFTLEIPPL